MKRVEIVEKLKDLIVSVADYDLEREMIGEDAGGIRRLGLNSLSLLRLLAGIEREFGVTPEPDEADSNVLSSLSGLAGYVEKKMEGKK